MKFAMRILKLTLFILLITFIISFNSHKFSNPGDNRYTGRMGTNNIHKHQRYGPLHNTNTPYEKPSLSRQEFYIHRPLLSHKQIKLNGQNITVGITWNATEIPNAHVILRANDKMYIGDDKISFHGPLSKKISIKQNQKGSEILTLNKLSQGNFALYLKLDPPKNTLKSANLKIIIKDNGKLIEELSLKEKYKKNNFWYIGIFQMDKQPRYLSTRGGAFMSLHEIMEQLKFSSTPFKNQPNKKPVRGFNDHLHKRPRYSKYPIKPSFSGSNYNHHHKKTYNIKGSNSKINKRDTFLKWIGEAIVDKLCNTRKISSFIKEGNFLHKSFLQKNIRTSDNKKLRLKKKILRIILRGKRMQIKNNILRLLFAMKKKKLVFRVLRVYLIRKIRVSKSPRTKRFIILKLKKLIKRIRKLKKKRTIHTRN